MLCTRFRGIGTAIFATTVTATPTAQTPDQRYTGWARPGFRPREYEYRRGRIMDGLLSVGDPALLDEPLASGMVFTVEPWYYNHELGVSVFVEEVVLVTDDGAEVLTAALPGDPGALEAPLR